MAVSTPLLLAKYAHSVAFLDRSLSLPRPPRATRSRAAICFDHISSSLSSHRALTVLLPPLSRPHPARALPLAPAIVLSLRSLGSTPSPAPMATFSMSRGRLNAFAELRAAGVPDTSIDAGFEHNGASQIEQAGFIDGPQIRFEPADWPTFCSRHPFQATARPTTASLTPAVVAHPLFALSWDPKAACGGPSKLFPRHLS